MIDEPFEIVGPSARYSGCVAAHALTDTDRALTVSVAVTEPEPGTAAGVMIFISNGQRGSEPLVLPPQEARALADLLGEAADQAATARKLTLVMPDDPWPDDPDGTSQYGSEQQLLEFVEAQPGQVIDAHYDPDEPPKRAYRYRVAPVQPDPDDDPWA